MKSCTGGGCACLGREGGKWARALAMPKTEKTQKIVIEVRCLEIEDTHLRGSGVVEFGGNEKEELGFFITCLMEFIGFSQICKFDKN